MFEEVRDQCSANLVIMGGSAAFKKITKYNLIKQREGNLPAL